MLRPVRAVLFFVPHLAHVVIIAIGEHYGWDWSRALIAAAAAVPWWSRVVGRGWSIERRFLLGPAVAAAGYAALAIAVLVTAEGPGDWVMAATIMVLTLFFVLYSFFVFEWKRKR